MLCFVQIAKLYNCVNILSYQFILIKRTSHLPLLLFLFFYCVYMFVRITDYCLGLKLIGWKQPIRKLKLGRVF